MECLFNDLIKKKEFEKKIKLEVEQEMKNINVHFEFFKSRSTGGKWNWTSLMGPDKKRVLEHFPVSQFISGIRGQDIEKLWREFFRLYKIIRKPLLSDQEIIHLKLMTKIGSVLFIVQLKDILIQHYKYLDCIENRT
jgi:hypothetical protein